MAFDTSLVRQWTLLRTLCSRHYGITVAEMATEARVSEKTIRRDLETFWKVDRIEDAEVTPVPFQRPDDFDLHEHLSKSFGVFHGDGEVHVKLRFAPTVARYVQESNWHASQTLTPQPDGSLLAEFDLESTEEIKRWVLSFGRHAEVLEPEGLRGEIVLETEAMLREYSRKPSVEVRHE